MRKVALRISPLKFRMHSRERKNFKEMRLRGLSLMLLWERERWHLWQNMNCCWIRWQVRV